MHCVGCLQAAALAEAAGPGPGSAAIAAAAAAARGPGRLLLPQLGWGLVSPGEGLLQPGWLWLLAAGNYLIRGRTCSVSLLLLFSWGAGGGGGWGGEGPLTPCAAAHKAQHPGVGLCCANPRAAGL
jgi:hypothetical protein